MSQVKKALVPCRILSHYQVGDMGVAFHHSRTPSYRRPATCGSTREATTIATNFALSGLPSMTTPPSRRNQKYFSFPVAARHVPAARGWFKDDPLITFGPCTDCARFRVGSSSPLPNAKDGSMLRELAEQATCCCLRPLFWYVSWRVMSTEIVPHDSLKMAASLGMMDQSCCSSSRSLRSQDIAIVAKVEGRNGSYKRFPAMLQIAIRATISSYTVSTANP